MKKLVEPMVWDASTKDVFLFRVSCAACGSSSSGQPVRFSKAGVPAETDGKQRIYQALYEQEWHAARHSAVRTLAQQMNYCPICKRVVCNRCFMICEDLDMCADCAAALQERGSPVTTLLPEGLF